MKTISKILMVMLLAGAIAGTLVLKQRPSSEPPESNETAAVAEQTETGSGSDSSALSESIPNLGLPRLVDLGADKCIPCKMMAPILEELKTDFAGKLDVQFIDVWKNPDAGATYGVEVVPTQIFYSASGEELRRHTGFIAREDILATWKELGVELRSAPEKEAAQNPK